MASAFIRWPVLLSGWAAKFFAKIALENLQLTCFFSQDKASLLWLWYRYRR